MNTPQVKGLFLSGGQSQRMGQDKSLLCYRGHETEIERWKRHFDELGLPFHWSQRPHQYPATLFPSITRLIDQNPGAGPLGALITAHQHDPEAAWLVLACDWPLLEGTDVARLLQARHPDFPVTVAMHQDRRQPLFALYEPVFLAQAAVAWQAGEQSLNRLLQAAVAWEVSGWEAERFLNANDPDARAQVEAWVRR
ncbi:molybdenum cofactor guanylyltransferase [Oligoflexus tunisiensis]|uniref:molybdenum cofactor guanylyltransferase n=1 Tax=Oligoflexus tunisiensis TaxID=708132 RepID=UPI00114D19D0|nr:molybdenum cofactor guanylyltransferase [Oligoflexus tunisiensis]